MAKAFVIRTYLPKRGVVMPVREPRTKRISKRILPDVIEDITICDDSTETATDFESEVNTGSEY